MDDFSYLLGVCLGDASLFIDRVKRRPSKRRPEVTYCPVYILAIECKDEVFVQRVANAAGAVLARTVHYFPIHRTNFATSTIPGLTPSPAGWHGFRIRLSCATIWHELRASRDAIRDGSYHWRDAIPADVLVGIVDSDGYVTVRGAIVINALDAHIAATVAERAGYHPHYYAYKMPQVYIPRVDAQRITTWKHTKAQALPSR